MNNEEKILNVLEQVVDRLDRVDLRLDKLEQGQVETNARLSRLEEDVEIIKEDTAITRSATNTLLDWAEQAEVQIKIPLYKKAE